MKALFWMTFILEEPLIVQQKSEMILNFECINFNINSQLENASKCDVESIDRLVILDIDL